MSSPHVRPHSDGIIRVLVVDDHRTLTELVGLALRREPDLECVAAAHCGLEAHRMVAEHEPDVVLMDVQLGDEDGLALTAKLLEERPALRVVVLTAHADAQVLRRAATAGACALIAKGGSLSDLLFGLRNARCGEMFVNPGLLPRMLDIPDRAARGAAPHAELTPRESLVLQLLAEGRHVARIATDLDISVHTCRGYVKTLLAKLGAHSQLEAVVLAGRRGLVETPRRA